MAQSKAKRSQRAKRRFEMGPSPAARQRSTRLRRIVIAFLVLVGLAGILAVTAPGDDGNGVPSTPGSVAETAR